MTLEKCVSEFLLTEHAVFVGLNYREVFVEKAIQVE